MSQLSVKAKLVRAALATAAAGASLAAVTPAPSASADPKQFTAFHGVGSDTIQDVTNAFSGFSGTRAYTPLTSSAPGFVQLASWDATGSACITTKIGGPTFNRPNGSGQGAKALARALDGGGFGSAACGGPLDISGQIDYSRSSSAPSVAGTQLAYVPFARDGVSFAYYRKDGNPVTTLSKAQLTAIFTNGATTINGVRIIPCGIQTQSGTFSFWNTAIGVLAATENTGTTECNNLLGTGVRAQENDAAALIARGDAADTAVDGTQVIIGFSAAAYTAKSNGATPDPAPPATVGMGAISDNGNGTNLGAPVSGTAPNVTANAAFYNDTVFGRSVYFVVPDSKINSPFGNTEIKSMFRGPTSAVCQADTTVSTFGFVPLPDASCGNTTALKGGYPTGQL